MKSAPRNAQQVDSLATVWETAAVAVPVAIVTSSRLGAIDLLYHLRAGAGMVDSRSVMTVDSFTFTAAGTAWVNQQWLAQVAMALAFETGGWFGLALLRALLVAGALILVMRACRASGAERRTAAWLTLASAALILPSSGLRPQLFGIGCFAVALTLLAERRAAPHRIWWLLPLAIAWCNLHGTYPLLFALGGAALLDDARRGDPAWRRLAAVGLVSLVGTLVNPFGVDVWRYVAGLTANPMIQRTVAEWQPPTTASFAGTAFLGSVPLVAWLMARSRQRPGWPTMVALAGFVVIGLMSTRGTLWWGMVAPVALAACLRPAQPEGHSSGAMNRTLVAMFAAVVVVALAKWAPFRSGSAVPFHLVDQAPRQVVEALRLALAPGERIFAAQAWGSWIEFALPANPVAVDTRIELFRPETWDRYADISHGREGWQDLLQDWEVRALAISASQQPELLERAVTDPRWRLVHRDTDGAVLVRQ